MALQIASALLISTFKSAVVPLKILTTDIFETGSSTANTIVSNLICEGIRRKGFLITMSSAFTCAAARNNMPGFLTAGFLNKTALRQGDIFSDNIDLTEENKNYGINIISKATLNIRVPTLVTIDVAKIQIPIIASSSYTIELEEGFFKQRSVESTNALLTNTNNQMPTLANAPLVTIRTNSRPFWVGQEPGNGTTTFINTKVRLRIYSTNNTGATGADILNTIIPGTGFIRLYRQGVLVSTLSCFSNKITFTNNDILVDYTGLLDAGKSYYILIDNGFAVDRDGFSTQAVTSISQITFTTFPSTDPEFPDLVSLQMSAANLLLPQSLIIIFGNMALTATASLTAASERVRYITGTTDTIGGLITQVSALVVSVPISMPTISTISIQGTFVLAKGQANIQSSFAMNFFVQMIPTTISAAFTTTAAVSVRKPAEQALTSVSTIFARGGYRKNASAALSATSSFTCSTTAVARATVLKYTGFQTGSVIRLPLYGTVNATVEFGGGRTHRFPLNQNAQGNFVPHYTPGSTIFYFSQYTNEPYLGGGFRQTNIYTTPGVKTFTVPSAATGPGGLTTANDFDGFVVIKGTVDYIGALQSEDAQGFEGSTTSSAQGIAFLQEVVSWGDGLKGFRNIGVTNTNVTPQLNYISPNFPASLTELRESFGKRINWNETKYAVPAAPAQTYFDYKLWQRAVEIYNRVPVKNVVEGMNTAGITTMAGCFKNSFLGITQSAGNNLYTALYVDLSAWNTANVLSMKEMFHINNGQTNQYIPKGLNYWNTSLVTDFSYMFNGAVYQVSSTNYTSAVDSTLAISGWNTSSATTMKAMFGAEATPSSLGGINANAATATNAALNGSLSGWNTANVTDMSFMFSNYTRGQTFTVNGSVVTPTASLGVTGWNTSSVTTMKGMFINFLGWADSCSSWNTISVNDFSFMFSIPSLFQVGWHNPNVTSWNTSSATNMMGMFMGNAGFNRPMIRAGAIWNTANVTNMTYMFWSLGNQVEQFNQNLSSWCVPLIASQPTGFDQSRTNTWTLARPIWGTCP